MHPWYCPRRHYKKHKQTTFSITFYNTKVTKQNKNKQTTYSKKGKTSWTDTNGTFHVHVLYFHDQNS